MIKWANGTMTHVGLVRERSSYTWDCGYNTQLTAIVWNEETEQFDSVNVGESDLVVPDLRVDIKDVLEAARELEAKREESVTIRKGKVVKVLNGKHKGKIGEVVWEGIDQFKGGSLFKVRTNKEEVFVNALYLEVFVSKLEQFLK